MRGQWALVSGNRCAFRAGLVSIPLCLISLLLLLQNNDASASVILTDAHNAYVLNSTYSVDLNQDGTNDFSIQHSATYNPVGSSYSWAELWPLGSNGYLVPPAGGDPVHLTPGSTIDSSGRFATTSAGSLAMDFGGHQPAQTDVYIGLQLALSDGPHYGWVHVDIDGSFLGWGLAVTVRHYAYESDRNTAIVAQVPEPSTLATLCAPIVAWGLARSRRRVHRA